MISASSPKTRGVPAAPASSDCGSRPRAAQGRRSHPVHQRTRSVRQKLPGRVKPAGQAACHLIRHTRRDAYRAPGTGARRRPAGRAAAPAGRAANRHQGGERDADYGMLERAVSPARPRQRGSPRSRRASSRCLARRRADRDQAPAQHQEAGHHDQGVAGAGCRQSADLYLGDGIAGLVERSCGEHGPAAYSAPDPSGLGTTLRAGKRSRYRRIPGCCHQRCRRAGFRPQRRGPALLRAPSVLGRRGSRRAASAAGRRRSRRGRAPAGCRREQSRRSLAWSGRTRRRPGRATHLGGAARDCS